MRSSIMPIRIRQTGAMADQKCPLLRSFAPTISTRSSVLGVLSRAWPRDSEAGVMSEVVCVASIYHLQKHAP